MTPTNPKTTDFPDELLNARVVFGLVKQGHIPTIEQMLAEGKSWDEIGQAIHWMPATAREYYEAYAQKKAFDAEASTFHSLDPARAEALPVLAHAIELLKKLRPKAEVWDRNDISSVIYQAEKHLLSTPRKQHGPTPEAGGKAD